MSKKFSKDKSETLYNKFLDWRDHLLQLTNAIIIVEGKRDIEVLKSLGVTEPSNHIIGYSQQSSIAVEDLLTQEKYKNFIVVPLVDFDRQGEEYLSELKSMNVKSKIEVELRMELRNLTRGKLIEFEDLFHILEDKLHPRYWLVLCQRLNLTNT